MTQYVCKVNSTAIDLDEPHEWSLVAGAVAPVQSWLMAKEKAQELVANLGPGLQREVTLTLGDPLDPVVVKRVYVVGIGSADNPQQAYLLLADVRIYLGFQVFVLDANVRRRLGDVRLIGSGLVTSTLADDVGYSPWTINNGTAYKWNAFKNQALSILAAPRHGRPTISWVTDSHSLSIQEQVIQETVTDGDGTAGLARAIESMPGVSTYVDIDGVLHVFDATPGAEKSFVESLPKALRNHGNLHLVDLSGIRPSVWRILVNYALEVRYNYPKLTTGDELSHLGDLENVLQVTDRVLTIPAGPWGAARVVGQGTWISIEEAFAAWGGKKVGPFDYPALTDTIVANHWFGDALQRYCVGGGINSQDHTWIMRIQELMRCWRTYFRVNSKMWDRVRHWWSVRAAVWDPVTGTRAPSPAYCNFNLTPLDNFVSSQINIFGVNVTTSYPVNSPDLAMGQPSGFDVEIVDEELMILAVRRDLSKFPGHSKLAPSPTIDGPTVTGDPGLNEAVLQKLQPLATSRTDSSGWNFSTVLTCAPASPNDQRRLYEVVVHLSDAIAALGGMQTTPKCHAPDQEMRTHLVEARVAWQDDDTTSRAILTTFGQSEAGEIGPDDPVRTLTPINLDQELEPMAKAMAAADLVSKLDHYEGSLAVPMHKKIVPLGSIDRVTHKVEKNRAVSVIHAKGAGVKWDALDFLPASARAYVLKEIQTQR